MHTQCSFTFLSNFIIVGLLKTLQAGNRQNQINKTRRGASSQCPGLDEMESSWQLPVGKQI